MEREAIPAASGSLDGNQIPNPGRRRALLGLTGLAAASKFAQAAQTRKRRAPREKRPAVEAKEAKAPGLPSVAPGAREQPFDAGWLFSRGDAPGAEKPGFSDAAWRPLDLPHDWSIEDLPLRSEAAGKMAPGTSTPVQTGPFDAEASQGRESTGWVVGGTGWYRKHFSVAKLPSSARVEVVFDGVYRNADVWLNGEHLGDHPYGYTGFAFDLTPHLNRGGDNVLAVRVRNEGKNSRWYSGSGIYRHVRLTVTKDIRIPLWGVQVTTPDVSNESAMVKVVTQIENLGGSNEDISVHLRLSTRRERNSGRAKGSIRWRSKARRRWRCHRADRPNTLVPEDTAVVPRSGRGFSGETVLDSVSVPFGIRSIEVDAVRGLRINGEAIKLKGGCVHHDNGVLGAAAIDRAEERRVELMKRNGFNAIRTSHNPPSPAFLDACDRLGHAGYRRSLRHVGRPPKTRKIITHPLTTGGDRDIESMVRRDRNHPSVVFWSIGNEIPERADPEGVEIAERLVATVKRLDSSRARHGGDLRILGEAGANVGRVRPSLRLARCRRLQLPVAGVRGGPRALPEARHDGHRIVRE